MLNQAIAFGPFRLDPQRGLMHGDRPVRLTPKAFSLLCFLAGERGRIVQKEELFRVVWRGTAVGDAALVTCVQELRRALKDKASKPRYIETLHRRGYRFIAGRSPAAREPPGFTGPDTGVLVGRGSELQKLDDALASARDGRREVIFVAGEAGIGKTTLVRAFLARAASQAPIRLVWGQSAEHYGATEPYHPILDALARACRTAAGQPLLAALEKHAPLWLAQMPFLVPAARLRAIRRRTATATPERMQRELTEALEAAAADVPLVIWLEDLHWSDGSTIDWLAAFARRPEPANVLVLGTFRPVEARAERHALHVLRDELARQGRARTLLLAPLGKPAVEEYVAARFPAHGDARSSLSTLARAVHDRGEGSPLFMVGILDELVAGGELREENGAWTLMRRADGAELAIPAYLRQVMERQIDRIAAAGQGVLEAGSVAGLHFSAALVAAALERPVAQIESSCVDIAREYELLVPAGTEDWPDGTVSSRFGFAHAMYREALESRIPAARGAEMHRRIAERLAAAYQSRTDEVAGQVAMHFERGRDRRAAVSWLHKAGDAAMRRKASREAAAHYQHALELLKGLPAGRKRDQQEVALRLALCAPLVAAYGMGSPKVGECASEALEACAALGDRQGHFAAHRVLWNHSLMRFAVPETLRHAHEVMAEAEHLGGKVELALAHRALGSSLIYIGRHREAAELLERGAALADRIPDRLFERYGEHPGMVCRAFAAWPKAFMGMAEDAVRLEDESIEHARRRDDPHGLAFALVTCGIVDIFQRDVARARAVAREVGGLSEQYGLAQWLAFAHEIRGWVAYHSGDRAGGIDLMRQGMERLRATGARRHSTRQLGNLAESSLGAGRPADARAYLDAAFLHREEHGEQYYAPELFRIKALLLRAEGAPAALVSAALAEAVAIARSQGAALFEARAAAQAVP
jgi:DNA-binding winged helix-turn-helix (wHTH) protein/tetratricopeptide (TPR) repeat protein